MDKTKLTAGTASSEIMFWVLVCIAWLCITAVTMGVWQCDKCLHIFDGLYTALYFAI